MNHVDIESDRKDCFAASADLGDPVPVDRDLPEQSLQCGGRNPRIPLRPDRDGQSAFRAGLRAGVPEDDSSRICYLPDPTYRELADREDHPASLSDW